MKEIRGPILITPGISLAVPPGTVLLLLASTALLHPMKICGHRVPHPLRMDMMNNPKTVLILALLLCYCILCILFFTLFETHCTVFNCHLVFPVMRVDMYTNSVI